MAMSMYCTRLNRIQTFTIWRLNGFSMHHSMSSICSHMRKNCLLLTSLWIMWVSTWTLCSIARLVQALAEIYRVLKPTGTLHLVEHVKHPNSVKIQSLQTLLTPIQKRIGDGCHLNRDIERSLQQAKFKFIEKQYFDAEGIPSIAQKMLMARVQKLNFEITD